MTPTALPTRDASATRLHPAARVAVQLLPRFAMHVDGKQVELSVRAERVVALLCVLGEPSRRSSVAGTLWPDVVCERSLSSLRTALWGLHKIDPQLVVATPVNLRLGSHVSVDLAAAKRTAHSIIGGTHTGGDTGATLAQLRRDLLSDWCEDWLIVAQENFRQLRLHALEALGHLLIRRGEHALAVMAGVEAVASEPLRESAHCLLMEAHLAEGNRSEAIRQYEVCARLLATELGLRPSPPLGELLVRARADNPVMPG